VSIVNETPAPAQQAHYQHWLVHLAQDLKAAVSFPLEINHIRTKKYEATKQTEKSKLFNFKLSSHFFGVVRRGVVQHQIFCHIF
jgi:hypothetical protein